MALRFLRVTAAPEWSRAMFGTWSTEHQARFEAATDNWITTDDPGEVLVAKNYHHFIVGITGWFPLGDGTAFMRWHGIREQYRSQGHSRTMFKMLCERLTTHYGIRTLYELSDSDNAVTHFQRLGFCMETDPDVCAAVRAAGGDFKHVLRFDLLRTGKEFR